MRVPYAGISGYISQKVALISGLFASHRHLPSEALMLATWLAALLFFTALQALLVVRLADRLTVTDAAQDAPVARAADPYARTA